jgi:hypothetical protein
MLEIQIVEQHLGNRPGNPVVSVSLDSAMKSYRQPRLRAGVGSDRADLARLLRRLRRLL